MITVADLKVLEGVRQRAPQDPSRWPPGMGSGKIEKVIDDLCGCAGRFNCACSSVFNQALVKAWTEHNS